MTEHYSSLEDVGEAFAKATDLETGSLFLQGQIVAKAIAQGFSIDETTGYCASMVKRSKRTVYRRYAVARTFPSPNPLLPYEFHALCADLVDFRQKDKGEIELQIKVAQAWLQEAADQGYSTRDLKEAIKASGGDVSKKTTVLLSGQFAVTDRYRLSEDTKYYEVVFRLPLTAEIDLKGFAKWGDVKLTVVQSVRDEPEEVLEFVENTDSRLPVPA